MEHANLDSDEYSPFTDDEESTYVYEALRRSQIRGPHAALFFAILEDALRCALSIAREQVRREALEWIFTNDYVWPGSFMNCCFVVNVNPEYLRRGLIENFPHIREQLRIEYRQCA